MKPVDSGQRIVNRGQAAPCAAPLSTIHYPVSTALIIGYGNPLRSDDGFGWHAGRLLAQALARPNAEVITCHQLTPELAEPLSRSSWAVFIDADAQVKPGDVHRRAVRPQVAAPPAFTHSCTPSGLLASAKRLYGHQPRAVAITVSAQSFAFGESLSPVVSAALPKVVDQVRQWLRIAGANSVARVLSSPKRQRYLSKRQRRIRA